RLLSAEMPDGVSGTGTGQNGQNERNGHLHPRERRLSWWHWLPLAAMVLLTLLLLVPQARAGVQILIRLGAVRIGLAQESPAAKKPPMPGATPAPTPLASPLDLAGATTLAEAQQQIPFPIRLPAYPPTLGPPQHVFLQSFEGPVVALVWVDP